MHDALTMEFLSLFLGDIPHDTGNLAVVVGCRSRGVAVKLVALGPREIWGSIPQLKHTRKKQPWTDSRVLCVCLYWFTAGRACPALTRGLRCINLREFEFKWGYD